MLSPDLRWSEAPLQSLAIVVVVDFGMVVSSMYVAIVLARVIPGDTVCEIVLL